MRRIGACRRYARASRAAVLAFVACAGIVTTACGKKNAGTDADVASSAAQSKGEPVYRTNAPPDAGPAVERDVAMWSRAREGAPEDLATLAIHEGAAGLIEAAGEAELRTTALRAMAFAPGHAQLPVLVKAASGSGDDEASVALDSVVEIASRPRRQIASEDLDELAAGCVALAELGRDTSRPRGRRVAAVRALRMMPCPKLELPTDVDAR